MNENAMYYGEQNSLLYGILENNRIIASNQAQYLKYNQMAGIIDFATSANKRLTEEYQTEINRVASADINKQQLDMNQKNSTMLNNEGITAGNSKDRIAQTLALQTSSALGETSQKYQSIISKAAQTEQQQNNALAQQKMTAYNTMLSNIISGPMAALQIQASQQQGYQSGYQKGSAIDTLNNYEKYNQGILNYSSNNNQGTLNNYDSSQDISNFAEDNY
jgi:hypothetical protein